MKSVVMALTGVAALLGLTTVGLAQGPERGQRPAVSPRAAPQPRAAPARPAMRAPSQRPANAQRVQPQRPAAARRAPQQRAVQQNKARQNTRADRSRIQQKTRAQRDLAGQQRTQRKRAAQERRDREKTRQRQAAPSSPKQIDKGPGRPDAANKGSQRAQPVARIRATDQQRRQIRESLFKQRNVQRIARNRLGVGVAIGNRIPRRHRLHRFTPALLAFAPLYASYSYLIVDDTICVVDPATYEVVDIIPSSFEQAGPGPAPLPVLALSPEQTRLIHDNVPKDPARVELRIRLALGAEIPRTVALFPFPEDVVARVPAIGPFRYVVVENDVVIVDPESYAIVLVITD